MVVKSSDPNYHLKELAEILTELRKHNMQLSSKKCVFRVGGGKFLGFMITCRGIEANPNKYEVGTAMCSPQNMKEV